MATLRTVLPSAARWEIVTAVPHPPDPASGATGFASSIGSPEEAGRTARADLIEGDAAIAATARSLGPVPTGSTVAHGDLATAVADRARELAAHVIVVVAAPSSRLDGVLARPTVDDIVAVAPCPVLVLPVR
jgi:nucleotide-binding universal stress UspA family protein